MTYPHGDPPVLNTDKMTNTTIISQEFLRDIPVSRNPNNHINAEGQFMDSHPHQFKIHGTWDAPLGIKVGSSVYIMSGSPYTEQISSDYPPLNSITDGFNTVNVEPRGDSRLPTFWMLNLGFEKTLRITDTTTATLFIDGYNISNNDTQIRIYPISNDPDEEMGEIQRILNPGLFQFGVRVNF